MWKEKAKKDINSIISKYCYDSYIRFNTAKNGKRYKKHRQYPVPEEAQLGVELLGILAKNDITREEEEQIKAFLLPYRTYRTEHLTPPPTYKTV